MDIHFEEKPPNYTGYDEPSFTVHYKNLTEREKSIIIENMRALVRILKKGSNLYCWNCSRFIDDSEVDNNGFHDVKDGGCGHYPGTKNSF